MAKSSRKAATSTKPAAPAERPRSRTATPVNVHDGKSPAEVEVSEATAAIKSDADARAKVDRERSSLEQRLEKLERESAENERKYQDSAREVADLRAKLDRPNSDQPPVPMKAMAFDEKKSGEQFKSIRPLNDPRRARILAMPGPKAKTFLVTPIGHSAGELSPAVVSNCADEADAKCEYFRRTGAVPHKATVKVEPFGDTKREIEERQRKAEQLAGDPLVDDLAAFEEFKRTRRMGADVRRTG